MDLFTDIQIAVHGATELLDSLLIFSKTGAAIRRERDSLPRIAEKAISVLRAHPDAEGVAIRLECDDPTGGYALVDAKQMQRAIYNLLLNACQSARRADGRREVTVSIATEKRTISLRFTDTGPGVAETHSQIAFRALRQRWQAKRNRPRFDAGQCRRERTRRSRQIVEQQAGRDDL
jgi:signal transduction histidine kinase